MTSSNDDVNMRFDTGDMFTLLVLDMPTGCEFGIDFCSWRIGARFRGVTGIPPGLHVCHYAAVDSQRLAEGQRQLQPPPIDSDVAGGGDDGCHGSDFDGHLVAGPRASFFFEATPNRLCVKKWDHKSEDLLDMEPSDEDLQRFRNNWSDVVAHLGSYEMENYRRWVGLSCHITCEFAAAMMPACGRLYSSEPVEPSPASNSADRLAAAKSTAAANGIPQGSVSGENSDENMPQDSMPEVQHSDDYLAVGGSIPAASLTNGVPQTGSVSASSDGVLQGSVLPASTSSTNNNGVPQNEAVTNGVPQGRVLGPVMASTSNNVPPSEAVSATLSPDGVSQGSVLTPTISSVSNSNVVSQSETVTATLSRDGVPQGSVLTPTISSVSNSNAVPQSETVSATLSRDGVPQGGVFGPTVIMPVLPRQSGTAPRLVALPTRRQRATAAASAAAAHQLTHAMLDQSHTLVHLYSANHNCFLAELQFTFLSLLIGQMFSGLAEWRTRLDLACRCTAVIRSAPEFIDRLLSTLTRQLQELSPPGKGDGQTRSSGVSDFGDLLEDVLRSEEDNGVVAAMRGLLANVCEYADPGTAAGRRLMQKAGHVAAWAETTLGWDLAHDEDDELPQIVQCD